MKAEELRIGNWVWEDYGGEYIVSVVSQHSLCLQKPKGLSGSYLYKDIKPIPLTEEWLVNFGFVLNHKNVETHSKGYSIYNKEAYLDIFIRVRPSEKYFHDFFSVFNHSMCNPIELNFIRKVKHVHQLQNLYFALTGKELTLKQ